MPFNAKESILECMRTVLVLHPDALEIMEIAKKTRSIKQNALNLFRFCLNSDKQTETCQQQAHAS